LPAARKQRKVLKKPSLRVGLFEVAAKFFYTWLRNRKKANAFQQRLCSILRTNPSGNGPQYCRD
jgi:hypothetical protein